MIGSESHVLSSDRAVRATGKGKGGFYGLGYAVAASLPAEDQWHAAIGRDAQVDVKGVPGGMGLKLPGTEEGRLSPWGHVARVGEERHPHVGDDDQDMARHPYRARRRGTQLRDQPVRRLPNCLCLLDGGGHGSECGATRGKGHETGGDLGVGHGEEPHGTSRCAEQGLERLSPQEWCPRPVGPRS